MKVVFGMSLALVLAGMLALAFIIHPTEVRGADYVEGVDVSKNQGKIDWIKVHNAGKEFAFVKVTEGGTIGTPYVDPYYQYNLVEAPKAGLNVGAYHVARPDTWQAGIDDPVDEANFFVNTAYTNANLPNLPPVLDLEPDFCDKAGPGPPPPKPNYAFIADWCKRWLQTVENRIHIKPIIYMNARYASNLEGLADYGLWIAWPLDNGSNGLPATGKWNNWVYWQYAWHGSVDGINGEVDLDRYTQSVGGVVIPVDKFGLLAPYIGLPSTILIGTVVAAVYVKRRKEKCQADRDKK